MELHGIGRGSSDCPINRKNPFLNLKGVVFRVCILQNLYPATLKSTGYYFIPSIQKIEFECHGIVMGLQSV